jgi:hypothetical protein
LLSLSSFISVFALDIRYSDVVCIYINNYHAILLY